MPGGASQKGQGLARRKPYYFGMNKPLKTARRASLTLGDLIAAIASESRNNRETAAAITDLFARRRVTLTGGRKVRVAL